MRSSFKVSVARARAGSMRWGLLLQRTVETACVVGSVGVGEFQEAVDVLHDADICPVLEVGRSQDAVGVPNLSAHAKETLTVRDKGVGDEDMEWRGDDIDGDIANGYCAKNIGCLCGEQVLSKRVGLKCYSGGDRGHSGVGTVHHLAQLVGSIQQKHEVGERGGGGTRSGGNRERRAGPLRPAGGWGQDRDNRWRDRGQRAGETCAQKRVIVIVSTDDEIQRFTLGQGRQDFERVLGSVRSTGCENVEVGCVAIGENSEVMRMSAGVLDAEESAHLVIGIAGCRETGHNRMNLRVQEQGVGVPGGRAGGKKTGKIF